MKILLLNQTFYPDNLATSQQLTDLAVYLSEKGHEVTVVTGRRGYEDQGRTFAARENYRGIAIHRVWSCGLGKSHFFIRFLDAISFDLCLLFRLLRLSAQDVTISFTSPPLIGVFGTLFSILKGGKNVQWLMDINPDIAINVGYISKNSLPARLLNAALEFTLRFADQVVVLDRWMKASAVGHGAQGNKICIIPPWQVARNVASVGERTEVAKGFRIKHGLGDKFVILYSGNHSIVHPLDTILSAARALREDPNVVFLFIGSGLRAKEVTEFQKRHQLKNIKQLPLQTREDYAAALGAANLQLVVMGLAVNGLVHPSKIYSVLSSGQPYLVVGPEESHLGDVLRECPYGFRVNQGDVEGFVQVVRDARLLSEGSLERIRIENRGFLRGRYGFDVSLGVLEKEVLDPWETSAPVLRPRPIV